MPELSKTLVSLVDVCWFFSWCSLYRIVFWHKIALLLSLICGWCKEDVSWQKLACLELPLMWIQITFWKALFRQSPNKASLGFCLFIRKGQWFSVRKLNEVLFIFKYLNNCICLYGKSKSEACGFLAKKQNNKKKKKNPGSVRP